MMPECCLIEALFHFLGDLAFSHQALQKKLFILNIILISLLLSINKPMRTRFYALQLSNTLNNSPYTSPKKEIEYTVLAETLKLK